MHLHEITPTIKVGFDDIERRLVVHGLYTPIPGFKGEWQKVAEFSSAEEWDKSSYAKMVASEHMDNMITWFWIDNVTQFTQ